MRPARAEQKLRLVVHGNVASLRQLRREGPERLLDKRRRDAAHNICRRADINRGTFYLHYEDKFALLDALIDEALAAAPPLEGTEVGPSANARRQTRTIICSTRTTTRMPAWRSASSSAAPSKWFPRLWRRPGFRARTPI